MATTITQKDLTDLRSLYTRLIDCLTFNLQIKNITPETFHELISDYTNRFDKLASRLESFILEHGGAQR